MAIELDKLEEAVEEKSRLENNQRERRKVRLQKKEKYSPVWFDRVQKTEE